MNYAATGGQTLPRSEEAGEVAPNPFEADIKDALEAKGIKLRSQYGASRYRIDLVAMHPRLPGRPVLAIECDGASYHSGAIARERDRLRQQQLMRRGWRFHRIWSTDWFNRREEEIERAMGRYEEAVAYSDLSEADEPATPGRPATAPSLAKDELLAKPTRGPIPLVTGRDSIDDYSELELRRLVQWVLADGMLRTDEDLMRDLLPELKLSRLGSRIRSRLEQSIRSVNSANVHSRQTPS